jgi:hypothetical protein
MPCKHIVVFGGARITQGFAGRGRDNQFRQLNPTGDKLDPKRVEYTRKRMNGKQYWPMTYAPEAKGTVLARHTYPEHSIWTSPRYQNLTVENHLYVIDSTSELIIDDPNEHSIGLGRTLRPSRGGHAGE